MIAPDFGVSARAALFSVVALVLSGCGGGGSGTASGGAGITWVDVTASTAMQAVSNTGYLADNSAQVTFTLPATPSVGDIIQVSGVGSGGWKIAQNAGQSIRTMNIQGGAIGLNWTAHSVVGGGLSAIASSSDGMKLVAAARGGNIYTSSDAGGTWVPQESSRQWSSVASSADGKNLVASVGNNGIGTVGFLYTSTDSGVTWQQTGSNLSWSGVASSADGKKLVAVVGQRSSIPVIGQIYVSADSGANWTAQQLTGNYVGVASSADGEVLMAITANMSSGTIVMSRDGGTNWSVAASIPGTLSAVAVSADGRKAAVVTLDGSLQPSIYISNDSGATWVASGQSHWALNGIAMTADGSVIVAVGEGSPGTQSGLFVSMDAGVSWQRRSTSRWGSVASSADGTRLAATNPSGSQILTSTPMTSADTAGFITGNQFDTIDLQYLGAGQFTVRSSAGHLSVN